MEEEESERLAALKLQISQTTDEMSFASAVSNSPVFCLA